MSVLTAEQWEAQMEVVLAAIDDQLDHVAIVIEPLGHSLEAVVAASPLQRAKGMIGRTFDDFDAMLFVQSHDSIVSFHNEGVVIPLLVAFFDATGMLVDQLRLEADDPTPRRPNAMFRYALELPGKAWDDLPEGSRLKLA